MAFREAVLTVVRSIPAGSTMTYQEVARRAGCLGASRAVGSFMKANQDLGVPCHRVVRSDGKVGAYNRAGGSQTKWRRLEEEGVDMTHFHL